MRAMHKMMFNHYSDSEAADDICYSFFNTGGTDSGFCEQISENEFTACAPE